MKNSLTPSNRVSDSTGEKTNKSPSSTKQRPFIYKPYWEIKYGKVEESFSAVTIPRTQRQVRGTDLRRSKRWLMSFPGIGGPYQLPLIDRLGRYTGASVYTLACEPADVLSSTVATVYGRLKRYAHAHNKKFVVNKYLRTILRVAAYYTISKNSYYMDRILFFLRNLEMNGKRLHPITLHYLTRCDEDKRFVYGQVCYQTNWLIFRACRPRDKLHHLKIMDRINPDYLGKPGSMRRGYVRSIVTKLAESVATIG